MRLASRGLRDMDAGAERIPQADERRRAARQARLVSLKGTLVGLALTVPVVLLPG
ncbi:MAG TPA: hypothetical protein VFX49_22190 [Chloroflexota bacterium]|nr:hypothetical protein [Chloroflexota bacterium]